MAGLRLACKLSGGYQLMSEAVHDVAPRGFNRCDRRQGQRCLPWISSTWVLLGPVSNCSSFRTASRAPADSECEYSPRVTSGDECPSTPARCLAACPLNRAASHRMPERMPTDFQTKRLAGCCQLPVRKVRAACQWVDAGGAPGIA